MAPAGDFQPFQSSTPQVGTITQWMDEKGFGWIESNGQRFFAHIKDFDRRQRRPKTGDEVRFIQGIDPKGRTCAKRVTFVVAGNDRTRSGGWVSLCLWLCFLLALPLLALLWLPVPWWMGAGWMLAASCICFVMYAYDKDEAVSRRWRVSESSLHLAEILGGWPGAFLAQRRLRHKCSKASYQFVFWSIVILYQIAAVDVMTGQRLSRVVIGFLR